MRSDAPTTLLSGGKDGGLHSPVQGITKFGVELEHILRATTSPRNGSRAQLIADIRRAREGIAESS
jgi:hypothetical protein